MADYSPPFLYRLNAVTGAVITAFPLTTPSFMLPMKFINGELYGMSLTPGFLLKIDTTNANIISAVPWCLNYPIGFCVANNHFWGVSSLISQQGTQRIYQFDSLLVSDVPVHSAEIKRFEIFPNPSNGNFTISFHHVIDSGTLQINNILGETVLEEKIYFNSKKEVNLKKVSKGIYFVKVFEGRNNYCRKLIVEHD